MCGDTTQMRYQKALKEITKLIGVNNEMREEVARYEDHFAEMQQALQEKDQKIVELSDHIQELNNQISELLAVQE